MPTPAATVGRLPNAGLLGIACLVVAAATVSPAHGQSCLCGTLADEFRAADAGLVREWIVQVPFDSAAAKIEHIVAGDGLVLAQSSDGSVHAIRASHIRPRLAFPGVENHPEFVFLLQGRWNPRKNAGRASLESPEDDQGHGAETESRDTARDVFLLPITSSTQFALGHPDDAAAPDTQRYVAAVTLLAFPRAVYEALNAKEREELSPTSPDALAIKISHDDLNSGRLHVAKYFVSIRDNELTVAPQHEFVGTVAWSKMLAVAAGHSWHPTIGPSLVVVTSELAVHALNRRTGADEWTRPTVSLTTAAAIQAGDWVYAPLQADRILRLPANPLAMSNTANPTLRGRPGEQSTAALTSLEKIDPISIRAGGAIDSAPVPLQSDVLWCTSRGLVRLEQKPLKWIRHDLPDRNQPPWVRLSPLALAGEMAVHGNSVFVVTVNNGAWRVNFDFGLRADWISTLPDTGTSGAFVADDVVVVAIGRSGIVGLSAVDGRELWRQALVGTPVAVAGGRAWLLDEVGRLTALDLASGSRRLSTCLGCFTLPVVSQARERLLLASPGGLVVSLAPPARPAPPAPAEKPPVTDGDAPPAADDAPDPGATPP